MFSGIIKATGTIERIDPQGGDLQLSIASSGLPWQEFGTGESIAVNGVCLTAVKFSGAGFVADISAETMAVTTFAEVSAGRRVNLEPSLSLGERLGGHLVSGHVDFVGTIRTRETDARSVRLAITLPRRFARYVAAKGSVTVDGVSLTVNAVSDDSFTVNIIPHTAEVTIVGDYRVGSRVNIELDLLARYLERLLAERTSGDEVPGLTMDTLRAHGYA